MDQSRGVDVPYLLWILARNIIMTLPGGVHLIQFQSVTFAAGQPKVALPAVPGTLSEYGGLRGSLISVYLRHAQLKTICLSRSPCEAFHGTLPTVISEAEKQLGAIR